MFQFKSNFTKSSSPDVLVLKPGRTMFSLVIKVLLGAFKKRSISFNLIQNPGVPDWSRVRINCTAFFSPLTSKSVIYLRRTKRDGRGKDALSSSFMPPSPIYKFQNVVTEWLRSKSRGCSGATTTPLFWQQLKVKSRLNYSDVAAEVMAPRPREPFRIPERGENKGQRNGDGRQGKG